MTRVAAYRALLMNLEFSDHLPEAEIAALQTACEDAWNALTGEEQEACDSDHLVKELRLLAEVGVVQAPERLGLVDVAVEKGTSVLPRKSE